MALETEIQKLQITFSYLLSLLNVVCEMAHYLLLGFTIVRSAVEKAGYTFKGRQSLS